MAQPDRSSPSLTDKAATGASWAALNQFAVQGLRFVVGIVLARLIAPSEFGLLAMVTVFIAISSAVAEGGFVQAIVQRKNLTDEDCSTAFWFNLVASWLMAGLVYLVAPAIAGFYNEPRLVSVVRAMAILPILSALVASQRARLNRELRFKKSMGLELPALIAGASVGIGMAAAGKGVWALVGQAWATALCVIPILWWKSGWRPGFAFRWQSFREMFGYGSKLAMANVLNQIFINAYVLAIGKLFSPIHVGFYDRAKHLQILPAQNIRAVVDRVMFPLLSSTQDSRERMKRGFEGSLRMTALVTFPVFIGMAVVAEPMIEVLVGSRWLPCVPYLKILCIVGALLPIHGLNLSILRATGASGVVLALDISKHVLTAVAIAVAWRFGIIALLWGQVACSVISLLVNTHFSRSLVKCPVERQMILVSPYLLFASVMGAGVWLWLHLSPWSPWVEFPLGVMLGGVIYAGILRFARLPENLLLVRMVSGYPVVGRLTRLVFGK